MMQVTPDGFKAPLGKRTVFMNLVQETGGEKWIAYYADTPSQRIAEGKTYQELVRNLKEHESGRV